MALLEREPYLAQLSTLLAEARRGRGRLVLVTGEAGIGKTSLVEASCSAARPMVRTLRGTCDPLVPRRAFTPVMDIAEQVGGDLRQAVRTGDRDAVHEAFLALVDRPAAAPAIVVIDDLHWADDATLELLLVVARRVQRLPVLLIGTYRDHDVGPAHPLRLTLGDVPAEARVEIQVPPLSVAAVRRLAGGRTDVADLHAVTAGNAFFVTEVLASQEPGVPTTVRDAVLRRVASLARPARTIIRAAAVLGPACLDGDLLALSGAPTAALAACTSSGLLRLDDHVVTFRHELARQAVVTSLPVADGVALHAQALEVLRARGVLDPARLARHAIGARDAAGVLDLAPAAAQAAARMGAHREAAAFYRAALDEADAADAPGRADLLERWAIECSAMDDVPHALEARRAALGLWRAAGNRRREGAALTDLSMLLWLDGAPEAAMRAALDGAEILETVAPDSPELAWAWAAVAQRSLVAARDRLAVDSARRAIHLAARLGDERSRIHALTSLSVSRIYAGDETGWVDLEAAAAGGRVAGLRVETARALINLVETARDFRRYQLATRYIAEATAYLQDHEDGLSHHLLGARTAALELEVGRWDDALARARSLLDLGRLANPVRVRALTVVGLVEARRGLPSARATLDAALGLVGDEPQDLVAVLAARAEAAWLAEDDGAAREASEQGLAIWSRETSRWWWSELAFWGVQAGAAEPLPHPDEQPFWLHATGRHADAAHAWQALGAPYLQAIALGDSQPEHDLRQGMDLANQLGATALAQRIARRLRDRGARRIARGPRPATRANPRRLTVRQMEILDQVVAGRSNREIAARLYLSPKTVEHHVSAVLRKLDAPDRSSAARAARELGIRPPSSQDGGVAGPD